MKTRWFAALAVVLLALLALRLLQPRRAETPAPASASTPLPRSPNDPRAASSTTPSPGPETPAPPPTTQPVPADGDAPPPPETPPSLIATTPQAVREALDNVQFALRDYRTVLGENPIGTNSEITKALTGHNLKQVKIPIPEGSSLNGEGEMCDRWNTPYFFHQLSGKLMEIRSAGPDKRLWTADDIVTK